MKLVKGLEGTRHVVTIDNFFISIELLRKLEAMGIYSTGTIWANRVGAPKVITNIK